MPGWVAAVLIRRVLSGGPAAVRRLACGLGPAPSFGGPLRDEGLVGSGEPAQGAGLTGERLIVPTLGRALEDAAHLGQQVGPAAGKVAEFSHRGGLLVAGEVAPSGVVPGGSGELGDQEPVPGRRETILVHLARIDARAVISTKLANYHGNRAVGLPWVVTFLVSFPGCTRTGLSRASAHEAAS
jgi:hypothetical protein